MGYYPRNYHHRQQDDTLTGFLLGCLTGFVAGAVLGILVAPHRGDITRRIIVRKAGETKDTVVEAMEEQIENLREKGDENGDAE